MAAPVPPEISVVIAYHDEPPRFLRECLESLRAQTVTSWEGIVVDDASMQIPAHQVLMELHDGRLRLIRHPENRGLGASRNTGIRAAAAPVIALLDADDRLHPEFLDATTSALQSRPVADWVATDWQVFGSRDEVWPFPVDSSLNCPAHFLFAGAGVVMWRRVWEQVGGYGEEAALRGGEDWDFWIAAAELGFRPGHVPRPLYGYRLHPGAMSRTTAPYTEHLTRRAIYRRRPAAFHSMGLDCPRCPSPKHRIASFLAQGYLVSSYAALERGERLRALRMVASGLTIRPSDRALLRQLGRALLPGRLRRRMGRMLS